MSLGLRSWLNTARISSISKKLLKTVQSTRRILGCSSLGFAFAKCEAVIKAEAPKQENLSREQCIKQACVLSVNSATTLLTTTSSALLDVCKIYKESLNRILALLEEVQTLDGDNPELWDAIVEARVTVNRAKSSLMELSAYMESVEKVVTSTSEAAFLAGAEYVCIALCERLYSAQKEIEKQIVHLKQLEYDYLKIQQEIARTKEIKKRKDAEKNKQKELNEPEELKELNEPQETKKLQEPKDVPKEQADENFSQVVGSSAGVA